MKAHRNARVPHFRTIQHALSPVTDIVILQHGLNKLGLAICYRYVGVQWFRKNMSFTKWRVPASKNTWPGTPDWKREGVSVREGMKEIEGPQTRLTQIHTLLYWPFYNQDIWGYNDWQHFYMFLYLSANVQQIQFCSFTWGWSNKAMNIGRGCGKQPQIWLTILQYAGNGSLASKWKTFDNRSS